MRIKKSMKRILIVISSMAILLASVPFMNAKAEESASSTYKVGNLMILGDSYSTFDGYIPGSNNTWYPNNAGENNVTKVGETWWHQFVDNTDATLVRNESYSGSTICNYGYDGGFANISFITRFDNLVNQGYFNENKIDTIIIFGGTNDDWANSPIGEEKYSDWSEDDKKEFLPAFCYLLERIEQNLPKARVVCLINEGLEDAITNGMSRVCEHYGADYVKLSDIDKQKNHPSVAGMVEIEKQLRTALEESSIIKYQKVDNATFKAHIGKTAPAYQSKGADNTGYVFAGWYEIDENNTVGEPIKAATNITGQVYAKFVPAYVLSVKAQNHQDVKTSGNLRLVSSVDKDANYDKVGFDVYFGNLDKEGYRATASGEKVYRNIIVNQSSGKKLEYKAQEVFGEESAYFSIAIISGIKEKSFNSTIYVKPFWITLDGTKVYGLGKYVCVQDGLDEIISIPVNLATAKKIAVGAVEMNYPKELTYIGSRTANRLLSEMEVVVNAKNHSLKCVGNAASVADGNLEANTDLYVSLRFKVADEYKDLVTVGKTRLNFTIEDTQFCNWEEEFVDLSDDVWDIQY